MSAALISQVFDRFIDLTNENGSLAEHDIVEIGKPDLPAAIVRFALGQLVEQGVLRRKLMKTEEKEGSPLRFALLQKTRLIEGPSYWELTEAGFKRWFASREGGATAERVVYLSGDEVPASDRFVSRTDNAAGFDSTISSLEDLETKLIQANDVFEAEDDRQAVVAEVRSFKALLQGGRVRATALSAARLCINGLRDLARRVGNNLVEIAATAAAAAITALLTQLL